MFTYRFTLSHPEIWNELFGDSGYELVEKKEHKKKRLEQEVELSKQRIELYKKYLDEEEEKLKTTKKQLIDLD